MKFHIKLNLAKDPTITVLLGIMHVLAVLVIFLAPVFIWVKLLVAAILLGSLYLNYKRYGAKKSPKSVLELRYNLSNNITHCYVNNNWHKVELKRKSSVVTSWLMCLYFWDANAKQHYKVLVWAWQQECENYCSLAKQLKLNK